MLDSEIASNNIEYIYIYEKREKGMWVLMEWVNKY